MEYRRRKSSRRRSRASGSGVSGGMAKAIVALIIIAAIVYIVSASKLGTWFAEKVIAPAFSAFDNFILGQDNTTDEATLDLTQSSDTSGEKSVTGEVVVPEVECFALQMGVYSDESNANREADTLKQRGAGGYVMEDDGRYRVLAAVYNAKESLTAVREQLQAEGFESAMYTFLAPNSVLRVTATQEQIDGLIAGFNALTKLIEDMGEAAISFDQNNLTPAQGRETASGILADFKEGSAPFLKVAEQNNPIISAAKTCYNTCESALSELADYNTESAVDFSSKMKYTHISIVHAYAKLAEQVSTS